MIVTAAVVEGRDGLRLYRLEAEATNVSTATISFDLLAFLLDRYRPPTVDHVLERFSATNLRLTDLSQETHVLPERL